MKCGKFPTSTHAYKLLRESKTHVTNYSFKSNKLKSGVLKSKSNKLNTIVSKVSNKLNYEASKSNKLNLNSLKWTNIDFGVWYMMRV